MKLLAQRHKQKRCLARAALRHLSPQCSFWHLIRKKKLAINTQSWILRFSAELGLEHLITRFLTVLSLKIYNENKCSPFLMCKTVPAAESSVDARGSNWIHLNATSINPCTS
jgi:hypothetical protein